MLNTIAHSFPPAPPVAAPPPVAAGPVPVPNAAQRAWLAGIAVSAPVPSVTGNAATTTPIAFDVRSGVPNPALADKRRVAVEPAAKVSGDPVAEDPWPPGSSTMPVSIDVQTDAGVPAGSTVFTAHLTMPPLRSRPWRGRRP